MPENIEEVPKPKKTRRIPMKTSGIERYMNKPLVSIDLETTGLSWRDNRILGISLSDGEASTYYWWDKLGEQDKMCVQAILVDEKCTKVFHNAKFDLHFLREAGYGNDPVNIEDTLVMSFLSDENTSHHLKDLAERHIDPNAKESKDELLESIPTEFRKNFDLTKADPKLVEKYARMDAYYTFMLYQYYKDEVHTKFKQVFDVEKKLLHVIMDMEIIGLPVDTDFLAKQGIVLAEEAKKLDEEILAELDEKVDLGSTDAVAEILIRKYAITLPVSPKTGKAKIDRWTLEKIDLPIAKKITRYKQLTHVISTYCTGLIEKSREGKLYCEFLQNGAVTGRFSSINPNLQNIPREIGDIRNAFKPPKTQDFIFFDYDQMEMRLFAHYSQDPGMIQAFTNNLDIHKFVASKLFRVDIKDVTEDQRRSGKTMNFGVIYGMGVKSFSLKLNVTEARAKEFRDWYFHLFPKVKEFMYEVMNRIKSRGFIFNTFGRYRRHKPDEAYKGVNSLIQGCAADVVKKAMVESAELLKNRKDKTTKMVLQVHDELVFLMKKSEQKELIPLIKKTMEDFDQFKVPLLVDVKWSDKSWGEKEKYEGVNLR